MSKQLAILAYHKIGAPSEGNWATWYYVPTATFESQMRQLRDAGWRVIDVNALQAALDEPDKLPDRAALITFDDGYRSVLLEAAPVLRRFEFPAVVFVPTDFIGAKSSFDADSPEPVEPICAWSELGELERAGISVQSHGVSHRTFSRLAPAEIQREFALSRSILERGLNKLVHLYSYAFNDVGQNADFTDATARHAGYQSAFRFTGGITMFPVQDRFQIPRIPVWPDSDLSEMLA